MTTHRTTPIRLAIVVALAVALMTTALTPASAAASSEERRLAATRAQLDAVKAEIEGARGQRAGEAAALSQAETQLQTVLGALNAAELAVQRQSEQVEAARAELHRLEDAQTVQRRTMANRAVSLYRQGSGAQMGAIFSSESADEAVRRSTYVQVLSRADRRAFESVGIAQVATDAQRRVLEAEEATLARVAEQQREIVADVEELRDERALVLADSDNLLRNLESQERILESESRELAALARRVAREEAAARSAAAAAAAAAPARSAAAAPSGGSAPSSGSAPTPSASATQVSAPAPAPRSSGGWTWPARGPVTSEYGQRWGRMHEGIDIGAPTGAAVVAARGGTVSFVGRMGGFGNLVLVDHGGGLVSAYAHLSAFAVSNGSAIGAGQQLGSIGCTGSCTGPHLHFEIRANGRAQNPRNYLG